MTSRDCLDDFLGLAARVRRSSAFSSSPAMPRVPADRSNRVSKSIESGLLQRHGVRSVDVAGHPEGNVGLSRERLNLILAAKRDAAKAAGLRFGIISQFCFDPRPIADWLVDLHANGFDVPIRIGLAGPANPTILLKFALRCGVGNSLMALQKHASTVGRLLKDAGPEGVVRGLGPLLMQPAGRRVESFHFFPFGGLGKTSAWIRTNSGNAGNAAASSMMHGGGLGAPAGFRQTARRSNRA